MRTLLTASLVLSAALAAVAIPHITSASSRSALTPISLTPPAGLSVETKDAPFGKGFDFRFKSDTSTTTISVDPLGMHHTDSGSISSKAGSISLSAKYSTTDRTIEIVAKRGGSEIGTFSWHVEAVLR